MIVTDLKGIPNYDWLFGNMEKILFVVGSLERNGTETFIMNVYRHLDRSKLQCDFLIFNNSKGGYYDEVLALGGEVFVLPPRSWGLLKNYRALKTFFKANSGKYMAVHYCLCSMSTIVPIYMAYKYKVPKRIIHAHGSHWIGGVPDCVLHYLHKCVITKFANIFLACSLPAQKYFFGSTKADARCQIIKNGIDVSRFRYSEEMRKAYREKLNVSDCFVIGHVGYFTRIKNHTFLIDVFEQVVKKEPCARLLLVGDGILKDQVVRILKQKTLLDKVILLENRPDINYLMQAMDCFVLPSLYEGLPLVLIEAQCAGLKVLASDHISREARITDHLFYLSLKEKPENWADVILGFRFYERLNETENMQHNGFSISDTVRVLQRIYTE